MARIENFSLVMSKWSGMHTCSLEFNAQRKEHVTKSIKNHLSCCLRNRFSELSHLMRPAKAQISLGIRPVWSVFTVCMKKDWIFSYPMNAQRSLWSDWADAQADLSLRWAHMPFCWFCHEAAQLYSDDCGHWRWHKNLSAHPLKIARAKIKEMRYTACFSLIDKLTMIITGTIYL